jgi:hypothetical protein
VTLGTVVDRGGVMGERGRRPCSCGVAVIACAGCQAASVGCRESLGAPHVALRFVCSVVTSRTSSSRYHTVEAGLVRSEISCTAGVALIALDRSNRDMRAQIDSHGCWPGRPVTLGAIIDGSSVVGELGR